MAVLQIKGLFTPIYTVGLGWVGWVGVGRGATLGRHDTQFFIHCGAHFFFTSLTSLYFAHFISLALIQALIRSLAPLIHSLHSLIYAHFNHSFNSTHFIQALTSPAHSLQSHSHFLTLSGTLTITDRTDFFF